MNTEPMDSGPTKTLRYQNIVDDIHNQIKNLEEKLSPFLESETPTEKDTEGYGVPFLGDLGRILRNIQRLNDRLNP